VVRAYARRAKDVLDDLLTCFRYPSLEQRKAARTTNAIERRFREVRRRTRPMGTFQDKTSIWNASCSPSSSTKTATRASPPPSP
jgi:transposase-like protein